MMGTKQRDFRPLPQSISLEDLVPKDNFYRRLESAYFYRNVGIAAG